MLFSFPSECPIPCISFAILIKSASFIFNLPLFSNSSCEHAVAHLASGGMIVTKWSSKPHDHQRVRVRENQRRHRERVKGRIAELESRLAETQLELQKALATVERLTAELASHQPAHAVSCEGNDNVGPDDTTVRANGPETPQTSSSFTLSSTMSQSCDLDDRLASGGGQDPTSRVDDEPVPISQSNPVLGRVSSFESWSSYETAMSDAEKGCRDLHPPSAQESTTRCREAYRIISEQNYADLEDSALRRWLEPGFRGASAEGGGCRVDNKLLFALLDYISSS